MLNFFGQNPRTKVWFQKSHWSRNFATLHFAHEESALVLFAFSHWLLEARNGISSQQVRYICYNLVPCFFSYLLAELPNSVADTDVIVSQCSQEESKQEDRRCAHKLLEKIRNPSADCGYVWDKLVSLSGQMQWCAVWCAGYSTDFRTWDTFSAFTHGLQTIK